MRKYSTFESIQKKENNSQIKSGKCSTFNFPNERITNVSNILPKKKRKKERKETHLFEEYLLVSDSGRDSHKSLHFVHYFIKDKRASGQS